MKTPPTVLICAWIRETDASTTCMSDSRARPTVTVARSGSEWILRDIYINGKEFTMEGKKIRLEKVVCPKGMEPPDEEKGIPEEKPEGKKAQKVISLADINKKER